MSGVYPGEPFYKDPMRPSIDFVGMMAEVSDFEKILNNFVMKAKFVHTDKL